MTTQPGLSFFELPAPSADRRVRRFLARGLDDAPDAGPGRAGDDASIRAQKTILPRTGVKWLIMTGSALAVIGQVLLTRLSPHGNYTGEIVPSLILTGLGVGCLFCSAIFGGAVSVRPGDAGISGALVNTSLQIGGSVGTTVLSLVFVSSVAGYEASHAASRSLAQDAAIHGYAAAFWWAAVLFALGFLVATFISPKRTATPVSQPAAPEPKRHRNHDGLPEPGPRSRQR